MGFDPISIGLMAVTAGLKAASASASGTAAGDEANYQAEVAKYNAKMASKIGNIEAENQSMKTRARIGAIKSNYAGHGVDVNTGTAADVAAAAASMGELDVQTIRSDAARRMFGFKTQADLYEQKADNAYAAGEMGAITSLVGGAADIYGGIKGDMAAPASPSSLSTSAFGDAWEPDFDWSSPGPGAGLSAPAWP